MKQTNVLLSLGCFLFLVACGGGSNDDMLKANHQVSMHMGGSGKVLGGAIEPVHSNAVQVGNTIDTVIVNGKSYNINSDHWRVYAINSQLSSARFGYLKGDDTAFHFFQGMPTSNNNVPKVGKATYVGKAIYLADGSETPVTTDAAFNVNFAEHTLNGLIRKRGLPLSLSATIHGNTFQSNPSSDKEATTVMGRFYGADAEEIAGLYRKPHAFSGTFGAKAVRSKDADAVGKVMDTH